MWAVGKMGAAGSCHGPAGFGHSQIHTGIQHRSFLQEGIFVVIVTLVPRNAVLGDIIICLVPADTAPSWQGSEEEQYREAASVIYRGCSILGQGTHI